MASIKLFPSGFPIADTIRYKWNLLPLSLQTQYNYLLQKVVEFDEDFLFDETSTDPYIGPNYYNENYCLALNKCFDFGTGGIGLSASGFSSAISTNTSGACLIDVSEAEKYIRLPGFHYIRKTTGQNNVPIPNSTNSDTLDFTLDIKSLTVGSVVWLYYYERMGIFKILGALMDDYNYRGKYPISSRVENSVFANQYTFLMESISLLYRLGISSNLRDRVCTYQRVLGVTIENNQNIDSEKNEGFMKTFNKLIDYMLEFYKAKQLAVAIQNTGNGRSSVATQTSIRDTIAVMQQHFESMEYGRNMINTFTGIATVYITISLIRLVKNEIGIPFQYDKPEEFIPAAYDILVLKKSVTPSTINRFTIYDNCASYGYRLLTDIQLSNVSSFSAVAVGSTLDLWLNDVEGIVEGYNNAYKSVEEPASVMV